ncbi:SIR2 family protein [Enterobacter hormaechei]|nr:SIR2 family protein [Enterobacter hormaechei subsp. steigerwaltii]HAV1560376.1 SIR2 family protein [Enterobacter hormaechei subsp. steigerwaltii]
MIDWPEQLIDDLKNKRVVLFLGSGVSNNSVGVDGQRRPKTWRNFLHNAAERHHALDEISSYLEINDFLTALDLLKNKISRDDYARLIYEEYIEPRYGEAPIHEEIYKLDAKIVLTPNFDKIYDLYSGSKSRGTVVIKNYYDADLPRFIRGDKQVVIKIHGSSDSVEQMIFGRKDYALARTKYKSFYEMLKSLILTHTFLFIGCGTDDPDIRMLLEDIQFSAVNAREHYFLSAQGSIKIGFKTVLETTMNLKVLEYDFDPEQRDHSDLTNSLRELNLILPWNV